MEPEDELEPRPSGRFKKEETIESNEHEVVQETELDHGDEVKDENNEEIEAEDAVEDPVAVKDETEEVPETSPLTDTARSRRYSPRWQRSKPPSDEEAFSEEALRKRAEKQVKRAMQLTAMTNYPNTFAGNADLTLETMSAEAQQSFLRVARYEAETWIRQERQRYEIEMRTAKRQAKLLDQLADWREKKDKEEQLERQRLEELDRKREEQEIKERERWKKRGEELRQSLAVRAEELGC
eukprot:symbB.v1.2.001546.t3/scaffold85.1/size341090/6